MGNLLNGSGLADVIQYVAEYVNYAKIAFMAICGLLLVLYAVYIGIRLAKAEDDSARKQAKGQLIYAIIGLASIIVLALVFALAIPAVSYQAGTAGELDWVVTTVEGCVQLVLSLIAMVAICFAVYIAWQLIKAEDDSKRKQAKMQLIYTVIGIISTAVLAMVIGSIFGPYGVFVA